MCLGALLIIQPDFEPASMGLRNPLASGFCRLINEQMFERLPKMITIRS